jgi:hypothetical protein
VRPRRLVGASVRPLNFTVRRPPRCLRFARCPRLSLLVLVALLDGCSLGRVNERMAYWDAKTRQHLPPGTAFSEAQQFFATRGLTLACCVSGPPGAGKYYFAKERKVGRFFFTEYDVAVLVALSASQKVETVRVERWGVGL